mmetsp:Transcript_84653/g.213472  ORF Transcript_84653/g.213472 Transcript_84653/m.213472 type:complete len:211 (-) Transcript_84653:2-634(-)
MSPEANFSKQIAQSSAGRSSASQLPTCLQKPLRSATYHVRNCCSSAPPGAIGHNLKAPPPLPSCHITPDNFPVKVALPCSSVRCPPSAFQIASRPPGSKSMLTRSTCWPATSHSPRHFLVPGSTLSTRSLMRNRPPRSSCSTQPEYSAAPRRKVNERCAATCASDASRQDSLSAATTRELTTLVVKLAGAGGTIADGRPSTAAVAGAAEA